MLKRFFLVLLLAILPTVSYPSPFGVSLNYLLIPKDPDHTHGYRGALWYEPPQLVWEKTHIYFDASIGHWWVPSSQPNHNLNIIAFAPYLRYYVAHCESIIGPFWPYVEASIGVAYLSNTRFGKQNLGMHFTFQDQASLGATLGCNKQLSLAMTIMHYSNGSLSSHNSGITIPLLLTIGYRF